MKKILYIFIALVLTLSAQAQVDRSVQPKPGPAPKVNLGKPQSFTLPNGLTVLVVENHKLPRVSFTLSLDNPPILEEDKKGIDEITSNLLGSGTSLLTKEDFNKKLDFYGASVNFNIHYVRGNSLSRYFPDVLRLAAQGVLDPLFKQEDLDSEKAKLQDNLKASEKSAQSISAQVTNALVYGINHPQGEIIKSETIDNITLSDVKSYYTKNFVPANAYLVVVGDVKFADVKKLATENFASWKKASAPVTPYVDATNLQTREINFVDVPHAVQSEITVNNVVTLKMTDADYYAALLANQILGGGADGRLFMNLREAHGWTYGSYSSISGNKYTTDFSATAQVRNAVTDSAVVEILNEINKVRTELPTQEELDLVKAKFIGNFVMNAEKPQTIASFALREKTQSLPANFYADYIKNINAVTLEQVRTAAKKYISYDNTRIVVVGKGSEVLSGLERLNIPIKYYDKYANPTSKPEAVAVAADVTPQVVLQKYIDAAGGANALSSVKTMASTTKATIQGQEIITNIKQTADGKVSQTMTMMGMTVMKTVFDGQTGYMEMQGQKKVLEGSELESLKEEIFPELNLLKSADVKLSGIEDVAGSQAYKIVSGKKTYFYDVKSGLKTAVETTVDMQGQTVTQRVLLSDYRNVKGLQIPFKQSTNMMGMDIELNVTDIKINEGVTDADFK